MCKITSGLINGPRSSGNMLFDLPVQYERRKEMKGQKSLRYLLVTAMLVVSIPMVAVGQLHEVIIDVSGMT